MRPPLSSGPAKLADDSHTPASAQGHYQKSGLSSDDLARLVMPGVGFEPNVDAVRILKEGHAVATEILPVQNSGNGRADLLVKCAYSGDVCVRIELYRAGSRRTLVRALGEVERRPGKEPMGSRSFGRVYGGTVIEGPGQGERQEWILEYDPL